MYQESAAVCDAQHDAAALAQSVHEIVASRAPGVSPTLLEVACGTGAYLVHLRRWYPPRGSIFLPR